MGRARACPKVPDVMDVRHYLACLLAHYTVYQGDICMIVRGAGRLSHLVAAAGLTLVVLLLNARLYYPRGVGFQVSCAVVHQSCADCPLNPAPLLPSRAPCGPHPVLPRLFFAATRPPTLSTYPPIHEDRRKVSGTFCRIGAGFLGQSAHLARNSTPFHTCSWRISPGILQPPTTPARAPV